MLGKANRFIFLWTMVMILIVDAVHISDKKPKLYSSYEFAYENSVSCLSSHMFVSCYAVIPYIDILNMTTYHPLRAMISKFY